MLNKKYFTLLLIFLLSIVFFSGCENFTENETYKLTISVDGKGEIQTNRDLLNEIEEGTIIELNADPDQGWEFSHWKGEVRDSKSKSTKVHVNNDLKITAVFKEKTSETNVKSVVQKGPFIQGTDITVRGLDENFIETGSSVSTQTVNHFGSFSIEKDIKGEYLEIQANGYFFNEVNGEISAGPISLRVLTKKGDDINPNVNILTTLARDRIKYLIVDKGKDFQEAQSQAEKEVMRVFHIPEEIIADVSNFEEMDISQSGESNAILLAISSVILGNQSPGQLSEFIAQFRDDFKEDGELTNERYKNKLTENAMNLNLEDIRNNLEKRYENLGLSVSIPIFEDYVDTQGIGVINKYNYELIVPDGTINNSQPEFNWTDSEKPGIEYKIQIAKDEAFSDIIKEVDGISTSHYPLTDVTLENSITYYWRVFVVDQEGNEYLWVEPENFTIKIGTVDLTYEQSPDKTPKLTWEESDLSNVTYNIEIANDSDFENIIEKESNLENTEYEMNHTLEHMVSYYYRVKVIDENGVEGEWTQKEFKINRGLYEDGEGTKDDPYLVKRAEQLSNIRNNLDKHFKQTKDIDLSNYSSDKGWNPIGFWKDDDDDSVIIRSNSQDDTKRPFTGSYNGNGYKISNLTINRETENGIGLFAFVKDEGKIENVTLENVSVHGNKRIGALVGSNEGNVNEKNIINCSSNGMVKGEDEQVGGLVGLSYGKIVDSYTQGEVDGYIRTGGLVGEGYEVSNSYSTSDVTGTSSVGGLVGTGCDPISDSFAEGSVTGVSSVGGLVGFGYKVFNCYAEGEVFGESKVGGLAGASSHKIDKSYAGGKVIASEENGSMMFGGLVGRNRGQIIESYATGNVMAEICDSVGGLVGTNTGDGEVIDSYAIGDVTGSSKVGGLVGNNIDAKITNSYAIGNISGNSEVGGLLGDIDSYSETSSCYYDKNTTGQSDTKGGTPKTTSEMAKKETFDPEWDFSQIWDIKEGESYPYLQWQENENIPYISQ